MTATWYALMTFPCQENLANRNLRQQGYWTFYPFERVKVRRKIANRDAYNVETVEQPYFPRYMFVALRRENESLYAVNETDGVAMVVYCGDEPLPVPNGVMTELMDRSDTLGCMRHIDHVSRKRFPAGQRVEFMEGSPLAGFIGTVSVDKGTNVRIWLDELGKMTVDPSLLAALKSA